MGTRLRAEMKRSRTSSNRPRVALASASYLLIYREWVGKNRVPDLPRCSIKRDRSFPMYTT